MLTNTIHRRGNAVGLPIDTALTAGEARNVAACGDVTKRHDSGPDAVLTDKGYDSEIICQGRHWPVIGPAKATCGTAVVI